MRPELEYVFIITKLKKINNFIYLFTYWFSFAQGGNYLPIHIHQKVFNDLYYLHKVETL